MLQAMQRMPSAHLHEPSPTLRFIAGPHAERIAALWPAPHGRYLEMPAQRRHLVHVVLALAPALTHDMARTLEGARADKVARASLGDPPVGFVKALGRLGEVAWKVEDYLLLFDLFADEGAGLVLRQTAEITPERIASLAALPAALRAPAIARHLTAAGHGALLAQAFRAISRAHPPEAVARAIERWERAPDAQRLFAMAADDVAPWTFEVAPFPMHPDFVRLGTPRELERAGRRFHNCLATYGARAAGGQIALYEWAGPPPAALSFARDGLFGWRLEEARGVGNAILEPEVRARVIADVEAAGVWVGSSSCRLCDMLKQAAGLPHGWIDTDDPVLTAFGAEC